LSILLPDVGAIAATAAIAIALLLLLLLFIVQRLATYGGPAGTRRGRSGAAAAPQAQEISLIKFD